jgi:hypothetical protein
LEKDYGIMGTVLAACDGFSALTAGRENAWLHDPNLPQYDIILGIRNVIRKTS